MKKSRLMRVDIDLYQEIDKLAKQAGKNMTMITKELAETIRKKKSKEVVF